MADLNARRIVEQLATPKTDFYTGSQIANNPDVLSKSTEAATRIIEEYGGKVEWLGTKGTVLHGGNFVEQTEIHGAAFNEDGHVCGLRFDISILKSLSGNR